MTMPAPELTTSPEAAARMMRQAALAAIGVSLTLALTKALAWWWTSSVAMLASFADSGLDVAASSINALAIRHALTPADREHRFGHGKTEALAGLAQAALVGGSALFLGWQSIARLAAPQPVAAEALGLGVMALSIGATLWLTRLQGRAAKASGSLAVAADRLHYVSDLAANLAVVAALVLSATLSWHWADGAFGLAIAGTIAWSAWTILRHALDQLVDRELPDESRAEIKAIAARVPGVLEIHDLRTRMSGTDIFIQLHAVIDGGKPLAEAHAISDTLEAAILAAFPNAEVLIHEDPSDVVEHRAVFAPG